MFTNLIKKFRKKDKNLKLEKLISDYILYKSITVFKYFFFKFL